MKKLMYFLILSISFIFAIGCSKNISKPASELEEVSKPVPASQQETPSNTKETMPVYKIKDYYPFKENITLEYEGNGNEYASYSVWVDYIRDNRIQLRKNNGGTELVNVIENKNGELKIVFSKEEVYYREDFTSKPSNRDEILLKEPLIKGTSWTLSDGRKRYISNVDVEVSTPAGSFKTIEVTTEGKGFKDLDYYALNTGLVKSLYVAEGMEVSSSLKSIKPNSSLTQNIKFYYPGKDGDKVYFIETPITFKTNDITRLTFEKKFKEVPSSNVGRLLGPNAKIKSLYLNNDVVYVDFTKELVSEMNAGSGYEVMILESITNTLGNYYNVSKVYITINNNPYESGHIIMKKAEAFTVNFKNTAKLNK